MCDQNYLNTQSADFSLSFRFSPIQGIYYSTSIDKSVFLSVVSSTNNLLDQTAIFVTMKGQENDNESNISMLVFNTADFFNNERFKARFYNGPKRQYQPSLLKETNCLLNSVELKENAPN